MCNLVPSDRQLSIRAETLEIVKDFLRQILHSKFNMQKVCANMMPFEQLEAR